jgi:uncharacterized protein with PQ loop repeat
MQQYIYLSLIASIFVVVGYIPEFINIIKTKQSTIENLYIWFIWSCGSIFSITFCALNEEYFAMSTHVIIFSMNSSTFLLKLYYYKPDKINKYDNNIKYIDDIINPIQIEIQNV